MSGAGLGNAAGANAIRADAQLLLHALHHRANSLQIWIPAPTPRVIRVADDVSVLRTLAADFTLLSHNHSILEINALGEVASVSENRPSRKRELETPAGIRWRAPGSDVQPPLVRHGFAVFQVTPQNPEVHRPTE